MVFNVYSIRDVNAGFNQPFCDVNDAVAKRNFAYAVNNSDLPGFAPGDFDLYKLGTFDTECGMFTVDNLPCLVVHGVNVYNAPKEVITSE